MKKLVIVLGGLRKLLNISTPQGSSLGPLLFLVYVNDIPNAVHDSLTGMYADDTGLYSMGPSISAMEETMNRDLSKLCCWLLANKLSINAVKSKFMVIASPHNMSKLVDKPEIKVLGKSLEQVTGIDYLGMTVDQYLRWDKHVRALGKMLKSAISSVKTVSCLPTSALVNIYHSLVESKLCYCNTVYENCNLASKDKLQILQNRAVRVISKNYTSPIEQVFTERKLLNVPTVNRF